MRKRIRNSLAAKVFLLIASLLILCSLLIYGIIMIILPKSYTAVVSTKVIDEMVQLTETLAQTNYADANEVMEQFCRDNRAMIVLGDETSKTTFGSISEESIKRGETMTYTTNTTFRDHSDYTPLNITFFVSAGRELTLAFLELLPLLLFLILLISALGAFVCSRVIVTPIAKISRISQRITELDMAWRCDTERKDEIGILSSNLNTMAIRLQSTMDELETANKQLTADVKKFQMLEEQHRNFFAAVSHELKTPLTILKGQIENMILGYGDYQNHEKYLPQALKVTEDIEYLVKEILSITKMETMNIGNSLETISLSEMLNGIIDGMKPLAEEKHIRFYQNVPGDVYVSVNRNLFSKALSNVIGNAIRHSNTNAKIYVNFNAEEKTLTVENTGVFIAENDLTHIFAPFYRADKSRSKATGGSGLGLYVVKTILDLHGIGYRIENTEKGVAFHFELK